MFKRRCPNPDNNRNCAVFIEYARKSGYLIGETKKTLCTELLR